MDGPSNYRKNKIKIPN